MADESKAEKAEADGAEANVTFNIGDKVSIVRDMNYREVKLKGRRGEVIATPTYNGDKGGVRASDTYLVRLEPVAGDPAWFKNEIYLDTYWLSATPTCICGNPACACGFTEKPS